MAKIVRALFAILLICSTLFSATDYMKELQHYDKKIETSANDELLRVHHSLISIYIYSIVNSDRELKKATLQRLVETSKILKLDSTGYSKELSTIDKKKEKKIREDSITPKIPKVINKYSNVLANFKNITDNGNTLKLTFDKKLSSKDLKSFGLKGRNSYREVFDIKGILRYSPDIKTPNSIENFKIAQYNKKTIRIVLQRSTAFKSKVIVSGETVEISYTNNKKIKSDIKENIIYDKYRKSLPSHKIIVLDAGHGGKDSGAIGSKREYEKDVVLTLTLRIGHILKKRGYNIYYTRTTDKFIKLRNRTKYANTKNADLFLSIHANASVKTTLHGVETFFLSPDRSNRSKNVAALENKSDIDDMNYFSKQTFLNVFNREKIIEANKLSLDVQQGMLNRLKSKYGGVRDGGVREAPFWVLVGAQMPAILVESGYISNKRERKRIFNGHYQNLLAMGIADGIDSYFSKYEY
jgi:N-acetylmuramoyl-L-alanine amidase